MDEPGPSRRQGLRPAPPLRREQDNASESVDGDDSSSSSSSDDWVKCLLSVKKARKKQYTCLLNDSVEKKAKRESDVAIKPKRGTLFAAVLQGGRPIDLVVDTWITKYNENREHGWLQLVSFLFHCTGCRGVITPRLLNTLDYHSLTKEMIKDFGAVCSSYPLDEKTEKWSKFRDKLCSFVQNLIEKCQDSIINDDFLMENMRSLLLVWVVSTCYTFRHTATFILAKIGTAFFATTMKLREEQSNLEPGAQLDELKRKAAEVDKIVDTFIKPIVTTCYRDQLPQIRVICVTETCKWMQRWPERFMQTNHTNLVAWLLTDAEPISLDACLQALKPFYSSDRFVSQLKEFTATNKDRFVALLYRPQFNIALGALNIVMSIFEHKHCNLSQQDLKKIHLMVFHRNQVIARTAAKFMNDTLLIRSSREWKLLKLTDFFIDSVEFDAKIKYRCADLVDSFLQLRCMTDWRTMLKILEEECGANDQTITQRQQEVMIEITLNCVKRTATGMPLKGRERSRTSVKLSKMKLEEVSSDKKIFTNRFIDALPRLLLKNMSHPKNLVHLLEITEYLELEMFCERLQTLELLKETVESIFKTHSDTDVITACMNTYLPLCDDKFALKAGCIQSLKLMKDRAAERYRQVYEIFTVTLSMGNTLSEHDVFELTVCLRKLRGIYFYHVPAIGDLFPVLFQIVKYCIREKGGILAEAASLAITCCYRGLRGEFLNLNMANPNQEDVEKVRLGLHELVPACETLLVSEVVCLEEASYSCLCEVLRIFGKKLKGTILACWEIQVTALHQDLLMNFVQKNVFIEMEPEIERDEYVKARELAKRSFYLKAFCRFIEENIFPVSVAADIFKHYLKYYDLYNEQIRSTIHKKLAENSVDCALAMSCSLIKLFESLPQPVDRKSPAFKSIVACARRFAAIFGYDLVKIRKAVYAVLNDGIMFSGSLPKQNRVQIPFGPAPRNIEYFGVMKVFVSKLQDDDLSDARECIRTYFPEEGRMTADNRWKPLQEFYRKTYKPK